MKRKKYSERRDPKKEKNLVLKVESSDSSDENSDMAYLTKRFQKMEQYKQNLDKAGKRNLVPDKRFNRKSVPDNIVKQALAAWGDSSSESERELNAENSSMMAVETEAMKYDSLFVLMAQSDDDNEEDEDDEVNFRDVQRNLKSYYSKKLRSLSNVLIDAYYSLVNDKEILTIELGEAEQYRDDLVVCVVDLNETIANLEQEKEALNERITSVENERDDLMVVVVDLKETIEGLNSGKHTLEEKVASTEEERDDLLVICTDLEETIKGLNREHRNASLGKGKEVASETHIMLEKELTVVKTSLCRELERNQQLQAELEKVRNDLQKFLKWTWSSDAVTAMYLNNSGNKQGIGFQREKTPYNPHSKYVTIPDNWQCTHCGNNKHFKENCQARVQSD
ncbi:MAR-binding filament-like protein 1 [Nicotiana sylvestris]|uniref:MAR-binding filament-like protein 1 n=1 Tax=Nicotiana sylvestris TaxID=4096 RepID=UPI00388C4F2F